VPVEDELRLVQAANSGVVVQPAVADRPHPDPPRGRDIGAAEVTDVRRLAGLGALDPEGADEHLRPLPRLGHRARRL
jgi:hypothetical protein